MNHSREPSRRQELSISVGNDADVALAKRTLLDIAVADKRVQREPPPRVYSDDLSADKTTLKIEYWASTEAWTETRYDLIDRLKGGLVENGVPIK